MTKLHKKDAYNAKVNPEGGLQASLCSNEALYCSSPSGFNNTNFISEDDSLDYLADILIEIFLDDKRKHANKPKKKSGYLLSGINKRTGR
jgi:hypothetical protein